MQQHHGYDWEYCEESDEYWLLGPDFIFNEKPCVIVRGSEVRDYAKEVANDSYYSNISPLYPALGPRDWDRELIENEFINEYLNNELLAYIRSSEAVRNVVEIFGGRML